MHKATKLLSILLVLAMLLSCTVLAAETADRCGYVQPVL